jgi:hypothetical protein
MSQPPSGQDPTQPAQFGYGYPGGYAAPYGAFAPAQFETVVPRPPRPAVVTIAIIATLVGVVVSGLKVLGDLVFTLSYRTEMADALARQQELEKQATDAPFDMQDFLTGYVLAISVGWAIAWLLAAVGATICAALAGRGRNGARVTLAVLAGLFVLAAPCSSLFSPVTVLLDDPGLADTASTWFVVSVLLAGALALVAVLILVLLLVPPANRFFRPGPGRRFASQTR